MADNVAITAGSGTNIAADDVSSVFYQKVKLDVGGDASILDSRTACGYVHHGDHLNDCDCFGGGE